MQRSVLKLTSFVYCYLSKTLLDQVSYGKMRKLFVMISVQLSLTLVPYSRKAVIKYEKFEVYIEIRGLGETLR
ncbi:hypothetical protein LA52FAK_04160 [Desulforhopalus sp. 52FAK]